MEINNFDYLEGVELEEEIKGKRYANKGIRFKEDEFYMLKHIKYHNYNFNKYIKSLIKQDIHKCINPEKLLDSNNVNLDSLAEKLVPLIMEKLAIPSNYAKKEKKTSENDKNLIDKAIIDSLIDLGVDID